jgi:hypothetical protein
LFWPPNSLSNSALTSSGTLKLTVAMLGSIVEDFNNADITDKCATVKDAAESALERYNS